MLKLWLKDAQSDKSKIFSKLKHPPRFDFSIFNLDTELTASLRLWPLGLSHTTACDHLRPKAGDLLATKKGGEGEKNNGQRHLGDHFGCKEVADAAPKTSLQPKLLQGSHRPLPVSFLVAK